MLKVGFHIIELLVMMYMAFNVLYITIYAFSAYFYKHTDFSKLLLKKWNKFLVLVPAYQSDEIIINTVKQNLKQSYPSNKYHILVIADGLKKETINELIKHPISVIPVKFEESSKAKSINTVLAITPDYEYDYTVIIDVDNIMHEKFLERMNLRLQNDEIVVQGHRMAKNLNTSFAILDGISEEINNQIFRKGHIALGVSAALSGSGKAVNFHFFKDSMKLIDSAVEDKEIEAVFLRNKIKILYETDAIVYDEKVDSSAVFAKQRRRWIASQFFDFNLFIFEGIYHLLFNKNFDYFDKALQKILLPRILLYGLVTIFSITIFFDVFMFGNFFMVCFLLCTMSYIISTPPQYFNTKTLQAAFRVPQAFYLMVIALFRSKNANKNFIHTKHQYISETDKNSDNSN